MHHNINIRVADDNTTSLSSSSNGAEPYDSVKSQPSHSVKGGLHQVHMKESFPELTNKLPVELLLLIFSWLSVKDLLSVKRVCHSWRIAAQDELLWKNHILTVHGEPKDRSNVKLMPAIKKICGYANNDLLEDILGNLDKLSTLNVDFEPPLSSSQVAVILDKYPQLQSITLCSCNEDILQSLEKLKTSIHLNEIIFTNDCDSFSSCPSSSALNIFKLFTDCNNFPALSYLKLVDNRDFTHAMHEIELFRIIISDIITKRSEQLLSLQIDAGCAGNVFHAVSSCAKLHTLLVNSIPFNANINIQSMANLRSLSLHAYRGGFSYSNTSLQDSLESGSWTQLLEVDISLYGPQLDVSVLKAVIDNTKQLKVLRYVDYNKLIFEQELENIGTLLKLESLFVSGFENISEEAICYVSECRSLRKVELHSHTSQLYDDHPSLIEMLNQLSHLNYVLIKDDDIHYGDEFGNIFLHFKSRKEIMSFLFTRRISKLKELY